MVPSAIVVHDELPLTPNGKVDRRRSPARRRPAHRSAPGDAAPATPETERWLAELWAQTLGVDARRRRRQLLRARRRLDPLHQDRRPRAPTAGIYFTPKQLFQHQTIAELAPVVSVDAARRSRSRARSSAPVPLTPIQHWFFEQRLRRAAPLQPGRPARRPGRASTPRCSRARCSAVVEHHDALRLRFRRIEAAWHQRSDAAGAASSPWPRRPLGAGGRRVRLRSSGRGGRLQATLELERAAAAGRAARPRADAAAPAAHRRPPPGGRRRLLAHPARGPVARLRPAGRGAPVSLPPKTTSFRDVGRAPGRACRRRRPAPSRRTTGSASSAAVHAAAARPARRRQHRRGHPDGRASSCDGGDERAAAPAAGASTASRSTTCCSTPWPGPSQAWTGRDARSLLAVEGHGREPLFDDVDLSRTVGWFTSIFPVALRLPADDDPGAGARGRGRAARARCRTAAWATGSCATSRPTRSCAQRLASPPWPEVSFNYLGQLDEDRADPLAERAGSGAAPRAPARTCSRSTAPSAADGSSSTSSTARASIAKETIRALAERVRRRAAPAARDDRAPEPPTPTVRRPVRHATSRRCSRGCDDGGAA